MCGRCCVRVRRWWTQMRLSVTHYQGRGRLSHASAFVAWVLYYLEVWANADGHQRVVGTIEGPHGLTQAGASSPRYVLLLENGATLACTIQPMPAAGTYEVIAYEALQRPRP